ncbi:hypothetical protein KSS87_001976 [Heliosperma pusillum]|nr:hypothetical protein KSS87_001976 [Heliosperma pusillum]
MGLESDEASVDSISLFVVLLCVSILFGHLLEKNRWINSTIIALLIGFGTGGVILLLTQQTSSLLFKFNEQLFFNYILPPIIFNAGFQVKKKQFFHNFTTIMLFGAIGTLLSFGVITAGALICFKNLDVGFLDTADYLAIGAIFAATDSVSTLQILNQEETPFVYSLVFGESVVNDATSVVLFNVIRRFEVSDSSATVALQFCGQFLYLFVASTLLGSLVGLLCAYITKKLYFGRHSTDREIAVMILMAYFSYMIAELFNYSGILSVFFCGIVMSHYTWHNVTESSRITTKHGFATMSFIAETFIFLYVGMDALDVEKWKFVLHSVGTSVGVSSILLGLVLVGRAASIFPLSLLANLTKKDPDEKIDFKQQVIIWWAGLMRGSVSMALAYNQVFGILTKPLLRLLVSPTVLHSNTGLSELTGQKSMTLPLLGIGQDSDSAMARNIARKSTLHMLFTTPTRTIHYYWRKFDNAFMRPVFGGHFAHSPGPTSQGEIRQGD